MDVVTKEREKECYLGSLKIGDTFTSYGGFYMLTSERNVSAGTCSIINLMTGTLLKDVGLNITVSRIALECVEI